MRATISLTLDKKTPKSRLPKKPNSYSPLTKKNQKHLTQNLKPLKSATKTATSQAQRFFYFFLWSFPAPHTCAIITLYFFFFLALLRGNHTGRQGITGWAGVAKSDIWNMKYEFWSSLGKDHFAGGGEGESAADMRWKSEAKVQRCIPAGSSGEEVSTWPGMGCPGNVGGVDGGPSTALPSTPPSLIIKTQAVNESSSSPIFLFLVFFFFLLVFNRCY